MSATTTPEQVLTDWRGHAAVLRARGHGHDAALLEQCAEEIAAAIAPLTAWLSESEAMLKSGKGVEFFRSRFAEWSAQPLPLSEMRGRQRWYRSIVVPQRKHTSAAKLQGLRGERAS